MSLSLAELTRLLPPQAPPPPAIPTGIAALDAVLLGGGLPRGRLTELLGPTGSGKTTLARAIVEETVSTRGWVAWIDAQRTLDPRDWTHLGDAQGVWMIRPHDAGKAAWCADVLLRSGAFTLVVLDGAPLLSKSNAVRLTRLARDGNCALVVLGDRTGGATQLGGAVRLLLERPRRRETKEQDDTMSPRTSAASVGAMSPRTSPASVGAMSPRTSPASVGAMSPRTSAASVGARTIAVRVDKGGTLRTVEVSCAVPVARRLCTHPEVPDRRGVARGPAGGSPRHARSSPRTECRGACGAGSPAAAATQPAGGAAAGVVPRQLHTAVTRARALG